MKPLELVVLALASFRISRVLIEDTIAKPFRDWLLGRWPGRDVEYDEDDVVTGGTFPLGAKRYAIAPTSTGDKLAKLISCYWCAGFWISLALATAYFFWPTPTTWVALPFALSALTGIIGVLMAEVVEE